MASTPAPAWAQTVQGSVLEVESGVPIYTADVVLLSPSDSVVGRSVTDREGRFVIRVGNAGSYRLRASRFGYLPHTSRAFELRSGQAAVAEFSLQLSPLPLDPIEAVVERPRPRRLVQMGFYRRQRRNVGQFLAPEDLESMRLHFPRDLFWGMNGIRVISREGRVSVVRSGAPFMSGMGAGPCKLSVSIDGRGEEGGGNFDIGSGPWTDLVHVTDIEAVEVYTSLSGVPGWAARYSPCGAILIWTRGTWR
jgi:hypothetical protein